MQNKKKNVKNKRKSTDSLSVAPKPPKGNITVTVQCLDGNQITLHNLRPEEAARIMAEVKRFYLLRYGIDFAVAARQGGAA